MVGATVEIEYLHFYVIINSELLDALYCYNLNENVFHLWASVNLLQQVSKYLCIIQSVFRATT